jgi:DNA topoisomerase-1
VTCPQCAKGTLQKKKSRRGKIFYSCSTYPACDYAVWDEPIAEPCPQCQWPLLTLKVTRAKGSEKVCPQKGCGYRAPVETDTAEPAAG